MRIFYAVALITALLQHQAHAITTCDFTWGSFFIIDRATAAFAQPSDCASYTNSLGFTGSVATPTLLQATAMNTMQRMCGSNTAPLLLWQSTNTDGFLGCAGYFPNGGLTTDLNCGLFTASILCTWNAQTIVYLSTSTDLFFTQVTVSTTSGTTVTTTNVVTSSTTISLTISTTTTTIRTTPTTTSLSTTTTATSRSIIPTTTTSTNQQTSTSVIISTLPTTISVKSQTTTTASLTDTSVVSVTSTILTCPTTL